LRYLTPAYTYTFNGALSTVVSAVDVGTDTFTSVGHPFANGDQVEPIINVDAGQVFLIDKLPTGITARAWPCYYVINKTADTFQLSLTSGGAVIDLTANANLDLTKWHFEKAGTVNINLTELSLGKKCRVVMKGHSQLPDWSPSIIPNGLTGSFYSGSTFGVPSFNLGNVYGYVEVLIDFTDLLTIQTRCFKVASNTAAANTVNTVVSTYFAPAYSNQDIVSITVNNMYPANGTIVEVYKA